MDNREALLVLNAIEGLLPSQIIALTRRFGDAKGVLAQGERMLSVVLSKGLAQRVRGWREVFDLKKELAQSRKMGVRWMHWSDAGYPEALRQIPEPPPILYYRGDWSERDRYAVSMVGSRQASRYGVEAAKALASELGRKGFTIISGMARGIDTAAHAGALEAGARTIAVLGSGFSNPYPVENHRLMGRIAENGLVLSEFPLTRAPLGRNFPRRNRIVSGLGMGLIVVEAAKRSGSLISANHALEQGRSVYAVPGRLDSACSEGANALIQQGAKLVLSAQDIVEDLQYLLPKDFLRPQAKNVAQITDISCELSGVQRKVWELLEDDPMGVDDIVGKTGVEVSGILAVLLELETKRLVRQLPGKRFVKAKTIRV